MQNVAMYKCPLFIIFPLELCWIQLDFCKILFQTPVILQKIKVNILARVELKCTQSPLFWIEYGTTGTLVSGVFFSSVSQVSPRPKGEIPNVSCQQNKHRGHLFWGQLSRGGFPLAWRDFLYFPVVSKTGSEGKSLYWDTDSKK